jgi:hypothetical protein
MLRTKKPTYMAKKITVYCIYTVCIRLLFTSKIINTVPVSIDRKSDSEPATGHKFFSVNHDFAISKHFNPFLTPQ